MWISWGFLCLLIEPAVTTIFNSNSFWVSNRTTIKSIACSRQHADASRKRGSSTRAGKEAALFRKKLKSENNSIYCGINWWMGNLPKTLFWICSSFLAIQPPNNYLYSCSRKFWDEHSDKNAFFRPEKGFYSKKHISKNDQCHVHCLRIKFQKSDMSH